MDMTPVEVKPVGDGKHTDITVSMSVADAARFLKMYSNGELRDFGIVDAKVVAPLPDSNRRHRRVVEQRTLPSNKSGRNPGR